MKFNLAASFLLVASALSSPIAEANTAEVNFNRVELADPQNWVAGISLFPSQIIAGYNAELDAYTAEQWADHVLSQCKSFRACTSTISFAADNSGDTGGRYWYGYVFRGGPTTPSNYRRSPRGNVSDSAAYTVA
ncbi:hypothetical protein DCS_04936 [Drechmeria coniospora]|uniref:Uncharacterized protein n=1 Tax=Drechmeria coniospora TaxID=98403 RepID=A0A151GLD7_DRECN|nr:hypothetical protein DCS_04936 [Drechmeria coniospora]KYK57923.1 hypothetical protein DCS_04936 [Drechmeria coniospora]ODA83234.1 hypothetical protein RJ55_01746 [Drechmeria coniospora]